MKMNPERSLRELGYFPWGGCSEVADEAAIPAAVQGLRAECSPIQWLWLEGVEEWEVQDGIIIGAHFAICLSF